MSEKGITVDGAIRSYLLEHSIARSDVHRRLVAETERAIGDLAIMQIAPEQGPFLTLLARMLGARLIVEVGTFTGLSALCLAEGLADGGRLICHDVSEEWVSIGRPFWVEAGVAGQIEVRIGPASETLGRLDDTPIDLAFLDADKDGYIDYYEQILPRLRPGGVIVADNTLYFGTVADPANHDANVVAIRAYNDRVAADPRVDACLVNIGDGLMLAHKR